MKLKRIYVNGTDIAIAEQKVPYVEFLLTLLPQTTVIREVWLFGSILEERCTEESDIDILFVGDLTHTLFWRSKDINMLAKQLFDYDVGLQRYDWLYHRRNKDIACGAIHEAFVNGVCIWKGCFV